MKKSKKVVIDFKAISDRICYLRLREKYIKISIINGRAHTEGKDLETRNNFYEKFNKVLENIPRYAITNCRSYKCADAASDHFLFITHLKLE